MLRLQYGELLVGVADSPEELGEAAVDVFERAVTQALLEADEITVIMSLGAAQGPLFSSLKSRTSIEWSRINVLHVDVYMGVPDKDPRSGGARMRRHLTDIVAPKAFYAMQGDTQPVEAELERYAELYERLQPCVCVVGIGETGHLAFIDPPADFTTNSIMVAVALAEGTRHQIAKAGIFDSIEEVPRYGLSLTIPALIAPKTIIALADEAAKAPIMKEVLEGPVSIMCPASILQTKVGAAMFLSREAAGELEALRA
ncbi:MAG: 6-phosphogluconolactonase [Propionibacteriaceae bacterium]|nr:6-phosphogluconolactonase [Propionibacteriaceae bacterium]